jgi:hypothetical protein
MLISIILISLALIAIFSAAAISMTSILALKNQLIGLRVGQDRMQSTMDVVMTLVHANHTASAVNDAQHNELSRRLADQASKISEHDEQISRLRTTGHLHGNKLREIDPAWKGYPERP